MTKRILALLMVLIMSAVLFAGCNKKTDDNSSIEWEIEYEYVDGEAEDATTSDGTASDGAESTSSGKKPSGNKDKNNAGSSSVVANSNTNKTGFPIVKQKETLLYFVLPVLT